MNTSALNLIYTDMPDRPDDSVKVSHFWGAGHYVRASTVQKGQCIRMHVHSYAHQAMVCVGGGRLMTEEAITPMKAGDKIEVPAGKRHAFLADADTIWLCIHPEDAEEAVKLYGAAA